MAVSSLVQMVRRGVFRVGNVGAGGGAVVRRVAAMSANTVSLLILQIYTTDNAQKLSHSETYMIHAIRETLNNRYCYFPTNPNERLEFIPAGNLLLSYRGTKSPIHQIFHHPILPGWEAPK